MATIAYGEPRFTRDIDIVVRLLPTQIGQLAEAFPEEDFYVSTDAMRDAIEHSSQLDILHPASGLKIDVMVADNSDFNASRFDRLRQLQVGQETSVAFASPEDVILKKLEYYKQGGSEKHLRESPGS